MPFDYFLTLVQYLNFSRRRIHLPIWRQSLFQQHLYYLYLKLRSLLSYASVSLLVLGCLVVLCLNSSYAASLVQQCCLRSSNQLCFPMLFSDSLISLQIAFAADQNFEYWFFLHCALLRQVHCFHRSCHWTLQHCFLELPYLFCLCSFAPWSYSRHASSAFDPALAQLSRKACAVSFRLT